MQNRFRPFFCALVVLVGASGSALPAPANPPGVAPHPMVLERKLIVAPGTVTLGPPAGAAPEQCYPYTKSALALYNGEGLWSVVDTSAQQVLASFNGKPDAVLMLWAMRQHSTLCIVSQHAKGVVDTTYSYFKG